MVKRMLIDATHPEETRAVVLDDRYLVDFDFETSTKLQLKGNIYLAKVTRVEPSLQAAFVEYGGNRHGFLAFSEIHPDYYQVPARRPGAARGYRARGGDQAGRPKPTPRSAGDVQPAETITTDADEETAEVMADQARRRARLLRSYKIQEVDQAPADHAGAGRQGGARQQRRGAHHLPVARRPLLRADAQHAARRRHQPQDRAASTIAAS